MTESASDSPLYGEGELRLLERLSAIINSLDEPQAVLERLMDLFLGAMGAERGLLLTFGAAGEARPVVVRNLSSEIVAGMTASWSRRAVEQMAGAGEIVVSEDVLHDDRFRDSQSVVAQNIQSLLCVPIQVKGQLQGAIYIDHRARSRAFSDRDIAFARALAGLSGVTLERTQALQALHQENDQLRKQAARYQFGDVIGASAAMQRLFERLEKAVKAPSEVSVLLTGEHGTGKTQIAKLIHRESPRRAKAFLAFGAGSVPETLVESELFGHRRGSFTGADADRVGLVERAQGGTLFLDDVNALPLSIQAKLLSFLQEREYRPIGGEVRKADVRVICATNVDLEAEVQASRFRADLYYRLNGIPLNVPPLRERKEDIALLAHHFLAHYSKAVAKEVRSFSPTALSRMVGYRWPGNVRELMSEVVHGVTMCSGPYIDLADFKSAELRGPGADREAPPASGSELNLERAMNHTIEAVVQLALKHASGNVSQAAKAIGVSRGKFYDLMARVGIAERPAKAKREPEAKASRKSASKPAAR